MKQYVVVLDGSDIFGPYFNRDEALKDAQNAIREDEELSGFRIHELHDKYDLGEDYSLFWHNLEIITGKTFSEDHREKIGRSYSC